MSEPTIFNVLVSPVEGKPGCYTVNALAPDGTVLKETREFPDWTEYAESIKAGAPAAYTGKLLGEGPIREKIEDWGRTIKDTCRIEVMLPDDLVASLPWERLTSIIKGKQCSILRRPARAGQIAQPSPFPVSHLQYVAQRGPLKWGLTALSDAPPTSSAVYSALRDVQASYGGDVIEAHLLDTPRSIRECVHFVQSKQLNALHIVGTPHFHQGVPHTTIGTRPVQVKNLIQELAKTGLQLAIWFSEDVNPESAMTALRMGARHLPSTSQMATLLCSGSPKNSQNEEYLRAMYARMVAGRWLDQETMHALPHGIYVSAVANPGRHTGFQTYETALGIHKQFMYNRFQANQLVTAIDKFEQSPRVESALPGALPKTYLAKELLHNVKGANDPTANIAITKSVSFPELVVMQKSLDAMVEPLQEACEIVEEVISKDDESAEPLPRYPAAMFYQALKDSDEENALDPILPSTTLSPPPEGWRLEFHFWLDLVEGGIPYLGRPHITPKPPYPVTLRVDVWSQEFDFYETTTQTLTLGRVGPTEHARFPLKLPEEADISRGFKEKGMLFVFLRHENELLAVFRVEAKITPEPQQDTEAQILEHAYLNTNWFQFGDQVPTGPDLTIYLRRDRQTNRLQVFTLSQDKVWGDLGANVSYFKNRTQELYLEIHRLAHQIALEEARGRPHMGEKRSRLFVNGSRTLSEWGYELFSVLFFERPSRALTEFGEWLTELETGASVTIATDDSSKDFIIPWGLIYDRLPPTSEGEWAEVDGFWGTRFKLAIRPSMRPERLPVKQPALPRFGVVYLAHPETQKMEKVLEGLVEKNKIQTYEKIRVNKQALPDLNERSFDLIHFFCHGHTDLDDAALKVQLQGIFDEYRRNLLEMDTMRETASANLLMRLSKGSSIGSYIYSDGGQARLAHMRRKHSQLPGAPIVVMSMCESAQVSSSGTGFVSFFLERGARAVTGTEGPMPWTLAREMDASLFENLLEGAPIQDALWHTRRKFVKKNVLALLYSLYGDGQTRLVEPKLH